MNTFCIPIKVEDEKDLYDRFLPSALSFSGELTAYLEDYLEERKLGEDVCLELHAPQEPDMGHFCKAFQAFVEKQIGRNKKKIRKADLLALLYLALGAVFITIGLMLAGRVDTIVAEIISAIGSFSLWGAAATFLETLPTLRLEKKRLEIFSRAEIRYKAG